eukprot:c43024_g1_i1 orf=384-2861(-)
MRLLDILISVLVLTLLGTISCENSRKIGPLVPEIRDVKNEWILDKFHELNSNIVFGRRLLEENGTESKGNEKDASYPDQTETKLEQGQVGHKSELMKEENKDTSEETNEKEVKAKGDNQASQKPQENEEINQSVKNYSNGTPAEGKKEENLKKMSETKVNMIELEQEQRLKAKIEEAQFDGVEDRKLEQKQDEKNGKHLFEEFRVQELENKVDEQKLHNTDHTVENSEPKIMGDMPMQSEKNISIVKHQDKKEGNGVDIKYKDEKDLLTPVNLDQSVKEENELKVDENDEKKGLRENENMEVKPKGGHGEAGKEEQNFGVAAGQDRQNEIMIKVEETGEKEGLGKFKSIDSKQKEWHSEEEEKKIGMVLDRGIQNEAVIKVEKDEKKLAKGDRIIEIEKKKQEQKTAEEDSTSEENHLQDTIETEVTDRKLDTGPGMEIRNKIVGDMKQRDHDKEKKVDLEADIKSEKEEKESLSEKAGISLDSVVDNVNNTDMKEQRHDLVNGVEKTSERKEVDNEGIGQKKDVIELDSQHKELAQMDKEVNEEIELQPEDATKDNLSDTVDLDVTSAGGLSKHSQDAEDEEYAADFMQEFTDLPFMFQDTAGKVAGHLRPDLQRLTDKSKVYFNMTKQQIEESFSPLVGRQYAPFLASLISYAFLFFPLIVVIILFEHVRALLSLQKVILFINIYLSAYFATLLLASFIIGSEPMAFFHKNSLSSYIYMQLLQALGYLLYLILQSFNIISSCSSAALTAKLIAVLQWVVAMLVGLHYYVTVFQRAMATKAPRTSWKIYGIYSLSFLILCLFPRIKWLKKQYGHIGDELTDKKN